MQFYIVCYVENIVEAIMDGLFLFTSTKKTHIAKLEDLLKELLKN